MFNEAALGLVQVSGLFAYKYTQPSMGKSPGHLLSAFFILQACLTEHPGPCCLHWSTHVLLSGPGVFTHCCLSSPPSQGSQKAPPYAVRFGAGCLQVNWQIPGVFMDGPIAPRTYH